MRKRGNRPRVIGTFEERIAALVCAQDVLDRMKRSPHFKGVDLDSLSTTIVSFLREPAPTLLGMCSYAKEGTKGRPSKPGDNTWRILVRRDLIHTNPECLASTMYHEFLHAVLGYNEGHGEEFQRLEALWPLP